MNRIKYNSQFNLIKDAIGLLPARILPYLETVDFVFDYRPDYIGSHFEEDTGDGRSYFNTSHCCFDYHTHDRRTTIFLFSDYEEDLKIQFNVIWHEIGHAIWERLNFCYLNWIPISKYEKDNGFAEVFAESFTRWLYPDRELNTWGFNHETQRKYDKRPIEFFNSLFR